jgi:predicted RNase H-like HicB family nuclease
MNYPIVIHKEPGSCYGVMVPDLPGCFSAGDTLDEAMVMAREAILGHLETLVETGQPIPEPQPAERHRADPRFADAAFWATVEADVAALPGRARRINISMNERVLDRVDAAARKLGDTRSGLLQRAAVAYIEQRAARFERKVTGAKEKRHPTKKR